MKSVVYELSAPKTLVRRERPLLGDADALGADDVLAATEFSAISPGTELAAWLGKPPLRPSPAYPRLVGYCNVARVLKVGERVSDVTAGDHVLTHQSHRSHLCVPRAEVLLVTRGLDAAMRRRLATTYLYHLGYIALMSGGYVPGHEVAVIGLGGLGLTTASLALAFGAQPLILTGRPAEQVPVCLAGARLLRKEMPAAHEWEARSGVDGVDLVVNTSDGWPDYRLALKLTRKGGTIVLLGFPGRGEPPPDFNALDSQYLYDKQLTIRQAGHVPEIDAQPIDVRFTLKRNLRYLFGLIENGRLDPSGLLALQVPWQHLEQAYESLAARATPAYSAVVDWTC